MHNPRIETEIDVLPGEITIVLFFDIETFARRPGRYGKTVATHDKLHETNFKPRTIGLSYEHRDRNMRNRFILDRSQYKETEFEILCYDRRSLLSPGRVGGEG